MGEVVNTGPVEALPPGKRWYHVLTGYHWFVLIVAALGWIFDCFDQQIFVLERPAVMQELVPDSGYETTDLAALARKAQGDYATASFLIGWGIGGLVFGVLGDRIGRAKTMMITILWYSLFTGLSALSHGPMDFCLFRFLTGLGIGGEFAVGLSLAAESMPPAARPEAIAMIQALSAVGNILAALVAIGFGIAEENHMIHTSPWRTMFVIGAIPALLAIFVYSKVKEPETWKKSSHDGAVGKQLGSYAELFGNPLFRKHALLGLALGCSGILGLWAVGFYTMDLFKYLRRPDITMAAVEERVQTAKTAKNDEELALLEKVRGAFVDPAMKSSLTENETTLHKEVQAVANGRVERLGAYVALGLQFGAFFGMYSFGGMSMKIGRKPMFALCFTAAFLATAAAFYFISANPWTWLLVPILGLCQLSIFGGYAVYFPELFPTRLRSTGISFCYNMGRLAAAGMLFAKPTITAWFRDTAEPLRYPGIAMATVLLLGLVVLPFLPETNGKPLPE
jgi:MFS family permease